MKVGNNLCQQQEGFRESWGKERSGRGVTENKNYFFFPSPRRRLWVTFEENRDEAMPGVRGGLCPALAWLWGRCPGEFPAWDPGCRGAVGADPSSFTQLELVWAPNTSKKIRNRNVSKREVWQPSCAETRCHSSELAFTRETWVIAPLFRGEGTSSSQTKAWFRKTFSHGFSGLPGNGSVQPLTWTWQWCATQPWGSFVAGEASWGHRAPQEFPAGDRISCSPVQ